MPSMGSDTILALTRLSDKVLFVLLLLVTLHVGRDTMFIKLEKLTGGYDLCGIFVKVT
jgi:hypothetical protein